MSDVAMAGRSRAWSPRERIGLAAFAAAGGAGLLCLVHPWYDPAPDAFTYVATARSLAAGDGYQYLGQPFGIRPPGFSLLIAPWVSPEIDFSALNLLVGAFGVGAVLALAVLLRERIGLGLAVLVAASVWLNPGFQTLCNQVMSDVPGAALVFGCLLLERRARRRGGLLPFAALGLAVGAAALVRSLVVLVIPASSLALFWRALPAGNLRSAFAASLALGGTAALVLAPWTLRNLGLSDAPADFTRIHSYSVAMWHEAPHDPGSRRLSPAEVLARVPQRFEQMISTLGSRLQIEEKGDTLQHGGVAAGHAALGLVLLVGLGVQLVRRRETPEIFAVLSLAVIAVYFGFSWRLLLPVYPLALGATVEALRDALRPRLPRPAPVLVPVAALLGISVLDLPPRRGWEAIEQKHTRLEAFASAVTASVDASQPLASSQAAFGAFLDRHVYNLRPAVRRGASLEDLESLFDRYGIRVLATDPQDPVARALEGSLRARYGEPRIAEPARLWTVRPLAPRDRRAR